MGSVYLKQLRFQWINFLGEICSTLSFSIEFPFANVQTCLFWCSECNRVVCRFFSRTINSYQRSDRSCMIQLIFLPPVAVYWVFSWAYLYRALSKWSIISQFDWIVHFGCVVHVKIYVKGKRTWLHQLRKISLPSRLKYHNKNKTNKWFYYKVWIKRIVENCWN